MAGRDVVGDGPVLARLPAPAVADVALEPLGPHAVLDANHRLDQRGRAGQCPAGPAQARR